MVEVYKTKIYRKLQYTSLHGYGLNDITIWTMESVLKWPPLKEMNVWFDSSFMDLFVSTASLPELFIV